MPKAKRMRVGHALSRKRRGLTMITRTGIAFVVLSALATITLKDILTPEVLAQDIHSGHVSGGSLTPVLDGSKQPELVPDSVAIRALIETLRVPTNPDPAALKVLHARIDRANLSDADVEVLVRELGGFDAQVKYQEAHVTSLRPSSSADSAAITRYLEATETLNSLFARQYEQLLTSLSPEGAEKLQRHLAHVKSRIKIYPTADMSKQIH